MDVQGQGLVLACAVPLFTPDRRFQGVFGMDVTLIDIIKDHLRRPGATGVLESYLLDGQGSMVVRSGQISETTGFMDIRDALEPKTFPAPSVVTAIRQHRLGVLELSGEMPPRIIIFGRLESIGWYYLETFDADRILPGAP